jgi:hypothetical protein
MITFNVVKEQHGWAIRMGEGMTTPFRSRDLAICEAHRLANAIRCHGQCAQVVAEGADPADSARRLKSVRAARPISSWLERWREPQ